MNIDADAHALSAAQRLHRARPQLVDCSLTSRQSAANDATEGRVSRRVRYRSQLRTYSEICEVSKLKLVQNSRAVCI